MVPSHTTILFRCIYLCSSHHSVSAAFLGAFVCYIASQLLSQDFHDIDEGQAVALFEEQLSATFIPGLVWNLKKLLSSSTYFCSVIYFCIFIFTLWDVCNPCEISSDITTISTYLQTLSVMWCNYPGYLGFQLIWNIAINWLKSKKIVKIWNLVQDVS